MGRRVSLLHGVCGGSGCFPKHDSTSRAVACRVVSGVVSMSDGALESVQGVFPDAVTSFSLLVLCVGAVVVLFAVGVSVFAMSWSSSAHRSDASWVSVSSSMFHIGSLLSGILVVFCFLGGFCSVHVLSFFAFAEVVSNIESCWFAQSGAGSAGML